ncbi:MAG: hypothetical protein ACRELY_27370 [Polyangiaceae bacterium]
MRKLALGIVATLLFVAACSSNNLGTSTDGSNGGSSAGSSDDTARGAGSSSDDAHAGCDQYLKCVGDATPDALPVALQAYGPSGTCWGGDGSLDSVCENACKSSMAELHKMYPSIASCGSATLGGSDAGSTASAGLGLDGACGACAESSCSAPLDACENDTSCTSLVSCLQACAVGDDACKSTCETTYDPTLFGKLGACLEQQCANACGG